MGIIRESSSPWASPIVKKRPFHPTLCRLSPNQHRIDKSLQTLGGAKYLSVLDLALGDHQVTMEESDTEKMAFVTLFSLFEYIRILPDGRCLVIADQGLAGTHLCHRDHSIPWLQWVFHESHT